MELDNLCGLLICYAKRYEKSYWCGIVIGTMKPHANVLKLKTKHSKSSTKAAELFAIDDDAMDFVEWIQLYVEQQTKSS